MTPTRTPGSEGSPPLSGRGSLNRAAAWRVLLPVVDVIQRGSLNRVAAWRVLLPVVDVLQRGRYAQLSSAPLDDLHRRRRVRVADVVNGPPPSIRERRRVT